ncbi:MAG: DNA-3-methyladenine glycosylase family protein, partial [Polynucleobacter victoriensis]
MAQAQAAPQEIQEMMAPDYWEAACAELMKHDRIMRKLIPKYPKAEFLTTRGDPFQTLARAIVGQQISVKAAQSVWDRTTALTKKFTAKAVLKLEPTQLREAGLSQRKVEYMQDLANHFENGGVSSAKWDLLDD